MLLVSSFVFLFFRRQHLFCTAICLYSFPGPFLILIIPWASPARCILYFLFLCFHLCLSLEELSTLLLTFPTTKSFFFFIFPVVFLSFHFSRSFQHFSSLLLLSNHFYPVYLSCDFHLCYSSFILSSLPSSVYLSRDFHIFYSSFILSSLPFCLSLL